MEQEIVRANFPPMNDNKEKKILALNECIRSVVGRKMRQQREIDRLHPELHLHFPTTLSIIQCCAVVRDTLVCVNDANNFQSKAKKERRKEDDSSHILCAHIRVCVCCCIWGKERKKRK